MVECCNFIWFSPFLPQKAVQNVKNMLSLALCVNITHLTFFSNIMLRPTPIPNHVAVCWESSIQGLTTMNRRHSSKGGDVKSLQSMPTSVRMELNTPFFLKWALCIDDTSLLSPLTARWFGISPPDTVLTDFLSGDTMVSFLSYNVPPCRP